MSGGELWHLLKAKNTLSEELSRIYIAEIALALGMQLKKVSTYILPMNHCKTCHFSKSN